MKIYTFINLWIFLLLARYVHYTLIQYSIQENKEESSLPAPCCTRIPGDLAGGPGSPQATGSSKYIDRLSPKTKL